MADALTEKYKQLLFALLPQGKAWRREDGTTLSKLLEGLAAELARLEGRALYLIRDVDPFFTAELLEDWERVLSLPDDCSADNPTYLERQLAVITKLSLVGGQTPDYLISIAEKLGFSITIVEYRPFEVGRSRVGDSLTNGDWVFHFTVEGSVDESQLFQVGRSRVGEPLGSFGNGPLECTIQKIKPANTTVNFVYA